MIAAIPAVNLVVWLAFLPRDDGRPGFVRQVTGEFIGSTMVLLFAVALLLATRARWLEPHFGGLDKMYRAHRRAGLSGFLLIPVHVALVPLDTADVKPGSPAGVIAAAGITILVLLTVAPRVPVLRRLASLTYDRWRSSHRFIGIFLIVALAHTLLVDALVTTTVLPLAVVLAGYLTGIGSYLYTLLLARFFRRTRRYVVQTVRRLSDTTVEVSLRPRSAKRMEFTAGQFLFVRFRAPGPLRRSHPFTISSSPREDLLRLTIKAGGDFTRRVHGDLAEGTRATLVGCYGMFDHRRGGPRQIWVAGGIGVTPFLSWIRDLDHGDPPAHRVDFFYTVRTPADALFLDEIEHAARRHPNLHAHVVFSARHGSLTAARIAAASGGVTGADVYLCGPSRMTGTLAHDFRRMGVPSGSLHYEEFNFR
ncbi:ferredoxin reductase family protein [Jidongwangia harbinensis]|uniref:ferredoxin reductase family protein n=1 Tax=Jidongwangia harbinensis TaxID=2878561 RepID=UPI001CD92E8B|nr:ferredoxin reductase family protein [Jidongwangia harbinensis]MCA2212127.1 ferredoxin reductase family protein [Jidongwangia harbinensis]